VKEHVLLVPKGSLLTLEGQSAETTGWSSLTWKVVVQMEVLAAMVTVC